MRTFKTKAFTRFADKAGISDAALCRAVGTQNEVWLLPISAAES